MGNNNFIPKTNEIIKFCINIIAAVGIVTGIVLFPIKTKITAIEKDIIILIKEHKELCDRTSDKLEKKVSKESLILHLKPIEISIKDLKEKFETFQQKNELFQQQLIDILKKGPT